jgi:hypothetical protein
LASTAFRPVERRLRALAAVIAAIALLIAACGQAAAPSGTPASPSVSSAPSPTQASVANSLATVTLPDSAHVLATKTYGVVPVNQIVVVLADGQGKTAADALATALGGRVVGQLDFINAYQIQTAGTTEADLTAALATATATHGVSLAAPNQTVKFNAAPGEIWGTRISPLTDPVYAGDRGRDYGLIGVQTAWDYIRGSGMDLGPVQVGVVDSGLWGGSTEFNGGTRVEFTDPSAKLATPAQETNEDGTRSPDSSGGHGSGVNVLIGGTPPSNGGPVGVASVLNDNLTISNTNLFGAQYGTAYTAAEPNPADPTIAEDPNAPGKSYQFASLVAIMSQVNAGSTVINMSWGPSDYTKVNPSIPKIYRAFYERMLAEHPNVLFVATAGNDGRSMSGSQRYPGGFNLPNVVTVGNVNNDGTINESSNTAGPDFEVSLFAPGDKAVRGYDPVTGEIKNTYGGTSMATPQVTATAALLRSLNKDLTAAQIKDIITRTAVNKDGTMVLAVDEAVRAVINLNRDAAGLPPLSKEELLGGGVVDAVAVPEAGTPGAYTVRGIVKATGAKGVDLNIGVADGEVTSGEEPTHLDAAGEATWTVKLDPPDAGKITVSRLDNQAGSLISIENIDVNGNWAGTFTLTDITLDAAAQAQAKDQGCDLSILEALKGQALPMTLDLNVDQGQTGTSTYEIDTSSIKGADGKSTTPTPQEAPVTYTGSLLTFKLAATSGAVTKMTGVVSQSAATATINGTISISGKGYTAKAVWTVTKSGA